MKKINLVPSLIILVVAIFSWSCANQQDSASTEEATADNVEAVATEETPKEDIPSPLKTISETVNEVKVEIQYGSPGVKGRNVWGELVPYGEVWRTGANEATWISFNKDVVIADNNIPAGKYGLFTIPDNGDWTVILNKTWDQWGAYDYSDADDLVRFSVTPEILESPEERMAFALADNQVKFMWENMGFTFEVNPAAAE
jgi:hypothetical protein